MARQAAGEAKSPEIMNGLLLDTHVWLWYAQGAVGMLSAKNIGVLDQARRGAGLWVSAPSVWEIGMLERRGRIQLTAPLRSWVERALAAPGIRFLPLDAAAAVESTLLPGQLHADPADRFLIAAARVADLTLATRDAQILEYSRQGWVRTLAV